MANVYVRSGAAGAGTGADWANAFLTLAAALTAKAAGDIFYVSEDHAETQASAMTLTAPGTVSNPNQILCVNHAGSVPPVSADLATTATISTTGASAITMNGFFYCYGIQFQSASSGGAVSANISLSATAPNWQTYKSCVFRVLGTTAVFLNLAGGTSGTLLDNCSFKFGSISHGLLARGKVTWINSPSAIDATGSLPTTLFVLSGSTGVLYCEGVDFSAISAKTLCPNLNGSPVNLYFKDCKLPASLTIVSATQTGGLGSGEATLVRCDSGATNYRNEKHNYAGDQTTETTIIRTGGASDGTTGVAFKVITTANSRWADPFTCIPISIWNDVAGSSVTATVCGIWGGGAVPNNDDIWIDVEYLGASGNPQGSFITSSKADILATGSGNPTDASTWGGSTTKFKMAVTFTPQQKGQITAYVRCAKASNTFYIDPLVTLT